MHSEPTEEKMKKIASNYFAAWNDHDLHRLKLLFDEKLRNIKFHFDLMHGRNNLNKAIELLDNNNKSEFENFVNNEVSFNPHNMLICKSKDILID